MKFLDVVSEVDRSLFQLLSEDDPLFHPAKYALQGPCKRIRPVLTILTAEVLGASLEMALAPALAIELVHTYSMIHDDLPSMDDDNFRRGKPSLHRVFSEGIAILTGDFFLTYAFEVLAKAKKLSGSQKVALIQELSIASGGRGMVGGQVMDLQATGKNLDLEALQNIHRLKTGALISCAVVSGGIVAQAKPSDLNALRTFAHELGILFQIVDDILDVTASLEKKGSEVSSDAKNQKTTYASFGLEEAKIRAHEHLEKALLALKDLSKDSKKLEELSYSIVNRKI